MFRLVQDDDGVFQQIEQRRSIGADQRAQQLPAGEGFAGQREVAGGDAGFAQLLGQLGQYRTRLLKFGERQQGALGDFHDGALRFHLEAADGIDLVAEHFDANRFGGFGRVHIHDAAADGVLPHHLDRIAFLITDAFEMRDQIIERNFVASAERQRKLPVEISGLDALYGRGHGRHGDGNGAGGEPP